MNNLSQKISALRAQFGKKLCILGHHYQTEAIIQHCDRTGDSLELARQITSIDAQYLVFCGVYFMGEAAALLTRPNQKVFLPDPHADCMMALMASGCHVHNVLCELQAMGKDVVPIAYVNTSVGLKAQVGAFGGAVCTSANAQEVLSWALSTNKTVLFLPDKHLARNTARALGLNADDWQILRLSGDGLLDTAQDLKQKRLLIWPGCCPIHSQMRLQDVQGLRSDLSDCAIYVHPECQPEVVEACDGAGSTSYLIKTAEELAKASSSKKVVIGTESNLVARLRQRHKDRLELLPLKEAYCPDMNAITEQKLFTLLQNIQLGSAQAVMIKAAEREPAQAALQRMLTITQ